MICSPLPSMILNYIIQEFWLLLGPLNIWSSCSLTFCSDFFFTPLKRQNRPPVSGRVCAIRDENATRCDVATARPIKECGYASRTDARKLNKYEKQNSNNTKYIYDLNIIQQLNFKVILLNIVIVYIYCLNILPCVV